MTADDHARPVLVRFGRLQTRGVLAGWSALQVAAAGIAVLLAAVASITLGAAGLLAVGPFTAILGGSCVLRWRGQVVIDWLPVALDWRLRTATGQTHYRVRPWAPRVAASFSLPGDTAPLCVYVDPATGAAMVHDPRRRRLTVAVRLTHPCYVLLSTDDQAQRVAAWSRVLASLAMTERQARIQVLESTLPDPGGAVHDFFVEHGNADDGFAAREYERLLDLAAPSSARHRTLVAVSVDLARSSRRVRAVGGGLAGAAAVLRDELTRFDAALLDCGLTSQGWLDAAELARVIRQAYDPSSDHTGAGIAVRSPLGPVAIDEHWDHIRHDAGYSAVLWISEWPRVEVAPHFLHALLFTPGIRKSISIVADGLPSGDALRQIRREKVEYLAEMQRNSRIGRITDLGADQEYADVLARENALVSGHGDLRFTGLIAVTASSREELAAAISATERGAGQAGCETRLLYGQQGRAFAAASLPLARDLGR